MTAIITAYLQYYIPANLEWKRFLKPVKYKDIIVESLKYMVENNRIKLFAFAPIAIGVDNHLHQIGS
jgi:putative transposase